MKENKLINGDNVITPNFNFEGLLKKEVGELMPESKIMKHEEILSKLLGQIKKVDFKAEVGIVDDTKVSKSQYHVLVIEKILEYAKNNKWGICKTNGFTYLYNGEYWNSLNEDELKKFLSQAALKMGIDRYLALHFQFINELYREFNELAVLPRPEAVSDSVLINLKNGTFKVTPSGVELKQFDSNDFITYQLPFDYDPAAKAGKFTKYLDEVLPNKDVQKVLAEFMGYVFVKPTTLKLEKALLLYGQGANGKSVFFDIIIALLGAENVSNFSLQNLTKYDSYQRAELSNRLLNYASEINGKLETSVFKQLVSGEPVEARQIYGKPFTMTNYGKLMFNCNELPREVEQTHAFFRRFIIVPYDITIPENDQDKQLSQKIIANELSGVFNWVLDGLDRLLRQKNFTACVEVEKQIDLYKKQSDSVFMFVDDEGWVPNAASIKDLKDVYHLYKEYCQESGLKEVCNRKFSERLVKLGFKKDRKNYGTVFFMERKVFI